MTTLLGPPTFLPDPEREPSDAELREWLEAAQPGDPYPFRPREPLEEYEFSQKRGGVIAKRIPRGEVFALVGEQASDPVKGRDAERLLAALRAVRSRDGAVTRFAVVARLLAIYREAGQWRFPAALEKGLEFREEV